MVYLRLANSEKDNTNKAKKEKKTPEPNNGTYVGATAENIILFARC